MLTEIKKPVGRPAPQTALSKTDLDNNSTIPPNKHIIQCEISPRDCPKFNKCSAPICPLDPDWMKREHLDGDRVCLYLRELGKSSVLAKLRQVLPTQLLKVILDQLPLICGAHAVIRRQLKKSEKTQSKILNSPNKINFQEQSDDCYPS